MSIEKAKFRAPVEPGVLLKLNARFVQKRARVCRFAGTERVEGKVTCEAEFTAMIADAA
jgi:3-hydroxyacyl-[acyl-carrier-protein] dehydratase